MPRGAVIWSRIGPLIPALGTGQELRAGHTGCVPDETAARQTTVLGPSANHVTPHKLRSITPRSVARQIAWRDHRSETANPCQMLWTGSWVISPLPWHARGKPA